MPTFLNQALNEANLLEQIKVIYWDRLQRNSSFPTPVLIFYQDPAFPNPQQFSDTFFGALSRFEGYICIISDRDNLPLKTFSPHQSDLVSNIAAWIQRGLSET